MRLELLHGSRLISCTNNSAIGTFFTLYNLFAILVFTNIKKIQQNAEAQISYRKFKKEFLNQYSEKL